MFPGAPPAESAGAGANMRALLRIGDWLGCPSVDTPASLGNPGQAWVSPRGHPGLSWKSGTGLGVPPQTPRPLLEIRDRLGCPPADTPASLGNPGQAWVSLRGHPGLSWKSGTGLGVPPRTPRPVPGFPCFWAPARRHDPLLSPGLCYWRVPEGSSGSPSQRAMTAVARQLPSTLTEVRTMSMTASMPSSTATPSRGRPPAAVCRLAGATQNQKPGCTTSSRMYHCGNADASGQTLAQVRHQTCIRKRAIGQPCQPRLR